MCPSGEIESGQIKDIHRLQESTEMKKEINRRWFLISSCVTGIYGILCFLSAGLVVYGAMEYNLHLFSVGKMLVPIWLLNPMGIVMALIGMCKSKKKMPFVTNIVINIVCWLAAGMIMVCFY